MSDVILEALGVCFEILGQEARPAVLAVLACDLEPYGEQRVLAGLDLLRREYSGKVTLAAIIEKIQQADGRPGVGEAWALAVGAADERNTVVWTPEIAQAWNQAAALYEFDKFGARKAFEEAYQRATRAAIGECKPVTWTASIGWDGQARDTALQDAVTAGRLTHQQVSAFLPAPAASGVAAEVAGLLTGKTSTTQLSNEEQRARLAAAREAIYAGQKKRAEAAAQKRDEFNALKASMIQSAMEHPLAVPNA